MKRALMDQLDQLRHEMNEMRQFVKEHLRRE